MGIQQKQIRQQNIYQLIIALVIILLLGILSSKYFFRIDLTSDKRYTLSDNTKEQLKAIDDVIFFKIYLTGDLPAGLLKLENATREILDDFEAYSSGNIQYQFIDPNENSDEHVRNKIYAQLYQKGLDPITLNVKEKGGGQSQKYIIPGIIVSYKGKEYPVNILKQHAGYSYEANFNASIQALEYELSLAIHQLTNNNIIKIGFIKGHNELNNLNLEDIAMSLSEFYFVEGVYLNEYPYSLQDSLGDNIYDLIVVAKPQLAFSEKDKFIIDQFIMNGGKSLWFIDNVVAELDSLSYKSSILANLNNLNIDDMLFRYGVRINPNLIQDMQCGVIRVNTSMTGEKTNFVPAPWIYSPLLTPSPNHTITQKLDLIKSEFVGTIDTVGENTNVKKSVILSTSQYSRTVNVPTMVDLSIVNTQLNPRQFTKSFLTTGILLEGKFNSVFTNRPAEIKQLDSFKKNESFPTKMIVFSDGDLIKNRVRGVGENAETLALGYDRYTKQTFGNKNLILNSVHYLCGKERLLETRNKEHRLRLLDKAKVAEFKLRWQIINVVLPILLVIICSIVYSYFRKRKYSKKKQTE